MCYNNFKKTWNIYICRKYFLKGNNLSIYLWQVITIGRLPIMRFLPLSTRDKHISCNTKRNLINSNNMFFDILFSNIN